MKKRKPSKMLINGYVISISLYRSLVKYAPAFKSQRDDPMVAGGDVAPAMKPPDLSPTHHQVPRGRPYMCSAHLEGNILKF